MATESKEMNAKDKLVTQLELELNKLGDELVNAKRLVSEELRMIQSGRHKQPDMIEIHHDKPMKLVQRIVIPVKEHPKYNFVGKLIGPKGNTVKMLQEQTGAKIAVFGRGSMRDKNQEEEMRKQGGKYAHLNDDLHVVVEVFAPPAQGYQQIGLALAELQKYLVPMDEYEDDIRHHQMQELMFLNGGEGGEQHMGRGRGRGAAPRGGGEGWGDGGPLLPDALSTPSPRGRGRGLSTHGEGQSPHGIGQSNRGMGQSTRGMGQSTRGMGQSTRGMGQSTRGMGQSTRGMGQSTRGMGQSTRGMGQSTRGMGQSTRGMGQSTRGMGSSSRGTAQSSHGMGASAHGMSRGTSQSGAISHAGRGLSKLLLGHTSGMGNGQSSGRGGAMRGRGASSSSRMSAVAMDTYDDNSYSSYGGQTESYTADDYSGAYDEDFTENSQFASYSRGQSDEATIGSFTEDWSPQTAQSYSKPAPARGVARGAGSRGALGRASVRSHPYASTHDTYY